MTYRDARPRAIPWNQAERTGSDWFRRTWHVVFSGHPDLSKLTPSSGRLADDRTARSHVLCVVIPEAANGVRLDVFFAYPDGEGDGKTVARLEAETLAYDSLLLQRIAKCGPAPVTINGWERHWILALAKEPGDSEAG